MFKYLKFYIKWHLENAKWKNCRHKRKAFQRALKLNKIDAHSTVFTDWIDKIIKNCPKNK